MKKKNDESRKLLVVAVSDCHELPQCALFYTYRVAVDPSNRDNFQHINREVPNGYRIDFYFHFIIICFFVSFFFSHYLYSTNAVS